MVDFTKKAKKHATESLEPGEQILEATVITPRGQVMNAAVAGGVGGIVGAGIAAKRINNQAKKQEGLAPEGTWADQFPKKKVFMSVTDRRVVVHSFSEMMGRPKDLLGWVPRDAIAGLQVQKGKLTHKGTLHFTDGSTYEIDLMKGTNSEGLVGLLGGQLA